MTPFYKFHGTGNDFIMIDGFVTKPVLSAAKIREACDRHFGIGADGLILVVPSDIYDFEMIYYNSDGSKASMCGNGARCAVSFCQMLGIASGHTTFLAGDGVHKAVVEKTIDSTWNVDVSIIDVGFPVRHDDGFYINTGTHHLVKFIDNVNSINISVDGPILRNDPRFAPHGVNVNWVSMKPGILSVRTYEKGVEAETLSCGTGVTASALTAGMLTGITNWKVKTLGGQLEVSFVMDNDYFSDIRLRGPAIMAFSGESKLL